MTNAKMHRFGQALHWAGWVIIFSRTLAIAIAGPSVTSVTPSVVTVNTSPVNFTVNGTGFDSGAVVLLNGQARTTTAITSTQLTGSLIASDMATVQNLAVTVKNSDNQISAETVLLSVDPAQYGTPSVTSIVPSSGVVGASSLSIAVTGQNFVPNSKVQVMNGARPTVYVSSTQLTATLSASDLVATRTLSINVGTKGHGGSNFVDFPIFPAGFTSFNRTTVDLDPSWLFLEQDAQGAQAPTYNDSAWTPVTVPHNWDITQGETGGQYYQGASWYRRHTIVDTSLQGKTIYLQFDAAFRIATVYVNGVFVGTHSGGFSAFSYNITPYVNFGQDTVIAVRVDWANHDQVAPLGGDMQLFGGIYRDVRLLAVNPVHISPMDYGSPGVYLTPSNITAGSATVGIKTKVTNGTTTNQPVTVHVTVHDASNFVSASSFYSAVISSSTVLVDVIYNMNVNAPHLWNSVQDPFLYTATVDLLDSQRNLLDEVIQPLGFRTFSVDSNNGLTLNGKLVNLHGASYHQYDPGRGWAATQPDRLRDFSLMQEMGVNAVRFVHYEHPQADYNLADSMGFINSTEEPLVGNINNNASNAAPFAANIQQQLLELIRQNYNHPSILFWGIANEITYSVPAHVEVPLISSQTLLAKAEDPNRLTTIASSAPLGDPSNQFTDVVQFNRYFGWYSSVFSGIVADMNQTHQQSPTRVIGISEYGGGASINEHQQNPQSVVVLSSFHPEEYQTLLHESHWQSFSQQLPFIYSEFIWNMFNFPSPGKHEGDANGVNDKGMVTFDHQTRKDAFYWYKVNWSNTPTTYITSRRFSPHYTQPIEVKVYSNTPAVSLTVNGITLAASTTTAKNIFTWGNVALVPGTNTIAATGGSGTSDLFTTTLDTTPVVPIVSSDSPSFATVAKSTITFSVLGAQFQPGAIVQINNQPRTTVYVSTGQLNVSNLPVDMATVGNDIITVVNPAGEISTGSVNFSILPVVINTPVVSNLSPTTAVLGQAPFSLTVLGSNFVPNTVVNVNGQPRTTVYGSTGSLAAPFLASDLMTAGSLAITAVSPSHGTSNALGFAVQNSTYTPVVYSVQPATVTVNSAPSTLVVNGAQFEPGAVVQLNGLRRSTVFVSSLQVTAQTTSTDLTTIQNLPLTVMNPEIVMSTTTVYVTVDPPVVSTPIIYSLNPSSATIGSSTVTVTLSGINFVPNSVVQIDQQSRPTVYQSSRQITTSIFSSDLAVGATLQITASTPYVGVSTTVVPFFVVPPRLVPIIYSVTPSTTIVNTSTISFVLNGAHFQLGAAIFINGQARDTVFVSSLQLAGATLPSDMATIQNLTMSVLNPQTMLSTTSVNLAVDPASFGTDILYTINPTSGTVGSSSFSVTLVGANFVPNTIAQVNNVARPTVYMSSTMIIGTVLASDLTQATTLQINCGTRNHGGSNFLPLNVVFYGSAYAAPGPYQGAVFVDRFSPPTVSGTLPSTISYAGVRAYPNPWRANLHAQIPVTIDNLMAGGTAKIFTVSGQWVKSLAVDNLGIARWDLTNDSGETVASGIYLYLVTSNAAQKTTGQIGLIR